MLEINVEIKKKNIIIVDFCRNGNWFMGSGETFFFWGEVGKKVYLDGKRPPRLGLKFGKDLKKNLGPWF